MILSDCGLPADFRKSPNTEVLAAFVTGELKAESMSLMPRLLAHLSSNRELTLKALAEALANEYIVTGKGCPLFIPRETGTAVLKSRRKVVIERRAVICVNVNGVTEEEAFRSQLNKMEEVSIESSLTLEASRLYIITIPAHMWSAMRKHSAYHSKWFTNPNKVATLVSTP